MKGQWLGSYGGSNSGRILIDIDEWSDFYEISAYLYDSNLQLPSSHVYWRTPDKSISFTAQVPISPIDPRSNFVADWQSLVASYPTGTTFPSSANVKMELKNEILAVEWITDIGTFGRAEIPRTKAAEPSTLKAESMDWDTFLNFVRKTEPDRFVFRGQSNNAWKLRTSFHRTGRANLVRFTTYDMAALLQRLSPLLPQLFDLQNPVHNAGFVALAQHHGYPTPLLDWTRSPFIAAFFAYRSISNIVADTAPTDQKVRIYLLDQANWLRLPQAVRVSPNPPHVSVLHAMAFANPRLIPQQALSTMTNVDDVEAYFIEAERQMNMQFLSAIDLPVAQRREVIRELAFMGITAGSLFPGLEGACEELKEKQF